MICDEINNRQKRRQKNSKHDHRMEKNQLRENETNLKETEQRCSREEKIKFSKDALILLRKGRWINHS